MDFFHKIGTADRLDDWEEKIEKTYARYGVGIKIQQRKMLRDRAIFVLQLKGKTRETSVFARAHDVQMRLKLPLFLAFTQNFNIYLVVSDQEIVYDHLSQIIAKIAHKEELGKIRLPYVVGYGAAGEPFVVDVANFPHLLVGGSSNSGKSVGLQALIACVTYFRSPNSVNFILIDVGATSLMHFEGVPHLSCPIIRDRSMAYQALNLLKKEMERRIDLQTVNVGQFQKLPRLVLIIDEFPALITGDDRQETKLLTDVISSLLQRGRHAGIHVVLTAQNPTMQNMRVDLGNITARIAFKCAKKNFSEVILGESGAENLLGQGDMYFKAPQCDGLQRIKGAFITPQELQQLVFCIKLKWKERVASKFIIKEEELQRIEFDGRGEFAKRSSATNMGVNSRLFARVMLWALGQESISCNMISETFSVGWRRANGFVQRLNECGIVDDLDAKLPRKVLPQAIEDLSKQALELLVNNGISHEAVSDAISNRA